MRRAGAAVAAIALLLLVVPRPVYAHHGGGSNGEHGWCAVRYSNTTIGASYTMRIACRAASGNAFDGNVGIASDRQFFGSTWSNDVCSALVSNQATFTQTVTGCSWGSGQAISIGLGPSQDNSGVYYTPRQKTDVVSAALQSGASSCGLANAQHRCRVVDVGVGTTMPPIPGEGGSMPQPPTGTTCAVDLGSGNGIHLAKFTASATGATSWAWSFGDTGSSTQQNPSHTYAGADNAGAKWVASVTPSSAGGAGPTCTLNFDFHGPSHVDGDTGPVDTGAACANPSLWDMVGWLKRLFIPCEGLTGAVDDFIAQSASGWPVGPMVYVVTELTSAHSAFENGDGPSWFPVRENSNSGCGIDEIAVNLPMPGDADTIRLPFLTKYAETCPDEEDEQAPVWLQRMVYAITTAGVAYIFLFALRNKVNLIMYGRR